MSTKLLKSRSKLVIGLAYFCAVEAGLFLDTSGYLIFNRPNIYYSSGGYSDCFRRTKTVAPVFPRMALPEAMVRLFPLVDIVKGLRAVGSNLDIAMRGSIEENGIHLELLNGGIKIMEIKISRRDTLRFMTTQFHVLPDNIKKVLFTDSTSLAHYRDPYYYTHSGTPLTPDLIGNIELRRRLGTEVMEACYTGLRSFACIETLWIKEELRDQGIGRSWYLNHIQPYLKKFGFEAVVVLGDCGQEAGTVNFYRNLGFSEPITFNILRGEFEDKRRYIFVKGI